MSRYETTHVGAVDGDRRADLAIPEEVKRGLIVERVRRPGGPWHVSVRPKPATERVTPTAPKRRLEPATAPSASTGGRVFGLPEPGRFEHKYRFVDPDHQGGIIYVRPALRRAAELELTVLTHRYLGRRPVLRWFVPTSADRADFSWRVELLGLSWPREGEIALRGDLTVAEAIKVLHHEVDHLRGGDEGSARRAEAEAIPPLR